MSEPNGNGGNGDEFEKTELFSVKKKEGVSMVVTLLEKGEYVGIDVRERVEEPKDGWDGWTKRGVTVPLDVFTEINKKFASALKKINAAK